MAVNKERAGTGGGARGRRLGGVAAVLLLLLLLLGGRNAGFVFNPPYLLLALNLVFITAVFTAVAVIAARSFAQTGSWPALWLGNASLLYAIAALLGGLLSLVAGSNAAVAAHNTGTMVAGFFFVTAAFFAAKGISPSGESRSKRLTTVSQVYGIGVSFMIFLAVISVRGLLPPYFTAQGPTLFRQMVLGTGVALFAAAGIVFLNNYRKLRSGFLYWWSLGLLLEALGLLCVMPIITVGTPLTWLGRITQYVGGIYVFIGIRGLLTEIRGGATVAMVTDRVFGTEVDLRRVVDSVSDAIVAVDDNQRIIYWNRGAAGLYGVTRKAALGKKRADVYHYKWLKPGDEQAAYDALARAGAWYGENIHVRPDGKELFVESTVQALKDSAGAPAGMVAVIRDITERRKAEEAIRLHANLLDNAIDPVLALDKDFKVITWNKGAEKLYGWRRDEMLGKFSYEILKSQFEGGTVEETKKELLANETWHGEIIQTRKDGSILTVAASIATVKDEDGNLLGIVANHKDITERKKAEEAVRLHANLVENAIDPVFATGADFRILTWNKGAEDLYGYRREEMVGKLVAEVLKSQFEGGTVDQVKKIIGSGAVWRGEIVQTVKNGATVTVLGSVAPMRDAGGNIIGYVSNHRDVTDLKRSEETLRETTRNFQALFNNKTVGLAHCKTIFNAQGQPVDYEILDVNLAWESQVSVKRSEVLGKKVTEVFPGVPQDLVDRHNRVAVAGEEVQFETYEPVTKRWYDVNVFSPKQGYFIALTFNITERKKAEATLRETTDFLNNLLDNANAPMIVWDTEFRVTRFNHAFEALSGIPAAEIIGQKIDRLFPEASRADSLEKIHRTMTLGEKWVVVEIPILRTDGVIRTVLWNSATIYAADGTTPEATIAQGQDVTERLEAEQALRESEEKYRNIVETAREGIWVTGLDGTVLLVNRRMAEMLGYKPEEMIGRHGPDFVDDDHRAPMVEARQRLSKGEKGIITEYCFRRKGGVKLWMLASASAIYDAMGNHTSNLGMFTDITERKAAEQTIARSAREWELTFNSMPDLVAILDTDYHIVRANKSMAEKLGLSPEKCAGLTCYQCVHKLNMPHELCPHRQSMADGKEHVAEVHEPNLGGDFIVSTTPLFDTEGKLFGTVHVARDITERKKAEEQLAYLASFPRLNPNPVIELDRTGVITYLSPAASRVFLDMAVGANGLEHPFLASLKPVFTSGEHGEQAPAGEVKVGERWYHQALFFLKDRARVYALDITGRKRAEEELQRHRDHLEEMVEERTRELKESEERFRKEFHSSPIAMRLLELENGRTVDANETFARLVAIPREEIIGRNSVELGILKRPEGFPERQRRLKETGKIRNEVMELIARTGEERICELSSDVIEMGGEKYSLSALVDITEKRRAEAAREAEHQDRLRAYEKLAQIGRLSGSIAHELRNPLAVIDSSLVLLKMKLRDADDMVNKHLDRIKAAVDRSLTAIQTLLEQARIKEPLLTTYDLRELAAEIVDGCRVPAGVKVVKKFPEAPVWVGADKEQIRLAFENIVKNAVEAMGGRGTLTLTVSQNEKQAQLVFQDTGVGIAPEHFDRVFEPLFTTKVTGVGFGLPNARMIIGKHGGTIEAKSEAGEGAAFTVCLPVRENGEVKSKE